MQFSDDSIEEVAQFAYDANLSLENIGARRLHSIIEKVMEDVSFDAPDMKEKEILINREFI